MLSFRGYQYMTLNIIVIPNAKCSEVVGWMEGALKIRIAAPPIEGRANEALIRFLSNTFSLSPSEIHLEKGLNGKHKRISLPLSLEEIKTFLSTSIQ